MKKIISGLFLIMGILTFSAPDFIDTDKIRQKNYNIVTDTDKGFVYLGIFQDGRILNVSYDYSKERNSAESVYDMFKNDVIGDTGIKVQYNIENKRYYASKYFNEKEGAYAYLIVGKNAKIKNCYTAVIYLTPENLDKKDLEHNANVLLNEAESFLIKQ